VVRAIIFLLAVPFEFPYTERMKNKKKSEVEKFKKDFCKLLAKYPDILVANNVYGNLLAYGKDCEGVCIPSSYHESLTFKA
jgi:GH25 family lysozyme M1 (1,4-beta-N-acetylmuramidase)